MSPSEKNEKKKLDESKTKELVQELIEDIKKRDPDQPEFLQAVDEVFMTLVPLFAKRPEYLEVARAMAEPERAIQFRVPWVDEKGRQRLNRGFRVQFNSAIGPYKGGLRFHQSVNLSVVKFLGFEQVFKNSLTPLPMGGGKGGSDINTRGMSDRDMLAFCKSFMTELYRHIGPDTDVPAGDIGTGAREIGYLLGQFKRITNNHQGGVLTGKPVGGSLVRPEATGYGVTFITRFFLRDNGDELEGKRVLVSGSGNVATYCAQKMTRLGAKVLTMSDSGGYVLEPEGFTEEQIDWIIDLKTKRRGRISEYAESDVASSGAKYVEGKRPWAAAKADIAAPCATQNEIEKDDAADLKKAGIKLLVEGANMPSTSEAIEIIRDAGISFIPAKAANAGGVATSGLEMSQNSLRLFWSADEVEERLENIMKDIYNKCKEAAELLDAPNDIQIGANAAGFIRVADAMIAEGQVFPSSSAL